MDPRLLDYYNRELRHLREVGFEFAKEYPKIASRLGLEEFECADPYVERLLEGFAFLAARVQVKLDAGFPVFTQHLLDIVYPNYLAPTPSMAIAQLQPDLSEGSLAEGFLVPRGTALSSQIAKGQQTACEYRTAHDVTLWPLRIAEVEYLANPGSVAQFGVPPQPGMKAALRLRLQATAGLRLNQLRLKSLPLFLRGAGDLTARLYEQLLAHTRAVAVQPATTPAPWRRLLGRGAVRRMGYEEHESLLPGVPQAFQGYQLLHEYFALPERFLFVELAELGDALARCETDAADVFVLLSSVQPQLANLVGTNNFALFCSPIVNLFPKRADRLHLTPVRHEYHILPDRARPMDFEVHSVLGVTGFGAEQGSEVEFLPFYGSRSGYRRDHENAYYSLNRRKRLQSSKQRRHGLRSSYIGHEAYVAIVDADEAPYRSDLRQLGFETLCTNRDLPLLMPVGVGSTDFNVQIGAPVESVRCLVGPTKPKPAMAESDSAWRLINQLSLNYLSVCDGGPAERGGAVALRELLSLYADRNDSAVRKQIEGILSVGWRNTVRRIGSEGPIVFGRGVEVTVNFEEAAFEGSGIFLIGAVLECFFRRYATINSFTETVISSSDRGVVMRWPARIGRQRTI